MLELCAISNDDAKKYFEQHSAFRGDFTQAISAVENDVVHGVIAFSFDGKEFQKQHISTDGNAIIGSLLYGAMVRVAMAGGYKTLIL